MSLPTRSYRLGVDLGLSWALTALMGVFTATWLVVAFSSAAAVTPALWAAIGSLVGVTVMVGIRASRIALGDVETLAVSVVALALQLAWWSDPLLHVTSGQRCMVTTATVFAAVAFASRGAGTVAVALVVAAQAFVDVTVDGISAAGAGLWPLVAAGIAAGVCVPALREAAARADSAAIEQRAAAVEEATAAALRDAQEELQGILHDRVVSALRTISLAGVTALEARTAARDAADAIGLVPSPGEGTTPVDLASRVRDAITASGVVVPTRELDDVSVPSDVAEATVGALAEALRNISRHARAKRVRVALRIDGTGFTLVTSDDGVGFRTSTVSVASHGLPHSVIRRMAGVGGRADVTSAPGRGTTIRLLWQPLPTAPTAGEPTRAERIAAALLDVRRPLAAVVVPYLAMTGVLAIVFTMNSRVTGSLAVWFAGLAILTLVLLERANRGLAGWLVAATFGYGLAGTAAAVLVLPHGSLEDYSSWPLGATTSLLALIAVVRPVTEAAAALLAHQAVIVVAVLTSHLGEGSWPDRIAGVTPAALSTVTPVVLGMILSQSVLHLGDAVTRANNQRAVAATASSARRARTALHERRQAELSEEILPFLRAVADGTVDHADPSTRRRARAMEHAARDELHLPGVLSREAREALHDARAAGCTVRILNGAPEAATDGDTVCRLLITALCAGAAPQEVVLSVNPSVSSTVGLVATPGDDLRAEALRREFGSRLSVLDVTPDATWAEISTA